MKRKEARSLLATMHRLLRSARTKYADLEWIALTIKYKDGRITLHSKDAPKRPAGLD